jgi:hypothetical protein
MKQYLMSVSRPEIPQNFRLTKIPFNAMESRKADFHRPLWP